jgi:hypothetical protein
MRWLLIALIVIPGTIADVLNTHGHEAQRRGVRLSTIRGLRAREAINRKIAHSAR